MKKISPTTKVLGIPSFACLALAGAIYVNSTFAEREHHNFVDQSSVSFPAVKQYHILESCLESIKNSKDELTFYTNRLTGPDVVSRINPALFHYPDVDNSIEELDTAYKTLTQQPSGNKVINTLEDQVRNIQKDIAKAKRGESEKFYQTQITQLQKIYDGAVPELKRLKKEIPSDIYDKQKLIKGYAEVSEAIAVAFAFFGCLGATIYGVSKYYDSQ